MAQLFANNAVSTLAAGIAAGATSLTLQTGDGAKFPSPTGGDYFMLTLTQGSGVESSWEIVKVTARAGDVLTIVRAQEGTAAAAWNASDKAELRVTALALQANGGYRWVGSPNVSGGLTGENSLYTVQIPGGVLEAGDRIRIWGLYKHTGGTTNAPRVGVMFGSLYIVAVASVGATDDMLQVFGEMVVTGAAAQSGMGWIMRPNASLINNTASGANFTENTASAITIDYRYRFDATGEQLVLLGYSVEVIKHR